MAITDSLYRLLVVEDNAGDVFLIKKALEEYGIPATVTVCGDGESAVRLIDSLNGGPVPHAIVLDLSLPRMQGVDVLRTILGRPALAGTPIMVFTSSPSPADKHRIKLMAGVRYLQKPTGLDNFLREVGGTIKTMLADGAARPEEQTLRGQL
jgi:CheY-like chemotaxis protein